MERMPMRVLVVVMLSILVASACSSEVERARGNRFDVAIPDDGVICEYGAGGRDGLGLIRGPILAGFNTDGYIESFINRLLPTMPLSNRFYEVSGLPSRDAGAPYFFEVLDRENVPFRIESKLHFVFNAEQACNWFDTHGGRNSSVPATYVSDDGSGRYADLGRYDMGFNVRDRVVTPWLTVLNEQFGQTEKDVFTALAKKFSWSELAFNADVDYTQEDGSVIVLPARDAFERLATATFSDRLDIQYGDAESDRRFYCGVGHNQANPDECRDIRVQILDIYSSDLSLMEQVTSLSTQKEADRIEIEQAKQTRDHEAELLRIASESADAKDDALLLEQRLSNQRITEAQIAAAEQAAVRAAELSAASTEGGVNDLTHQESLQAAQIEVAACDAAEVTGLDCVYLIAVLNGQHLPDSLGGTFIIPQASTPGE
ncbi:hypothetical protein HQ535_10490 [bacterium]|nr:hypothetical protein [bacterium]